MASFPCSPGVCTAVGPCWSVALTAGQGCVRGGHSLHPTIPFSPLPPLPCLPACRAATAVSLGYGAVGWRGRLHPTAAAIERSIAITYGTV